MVTAEEMPDPPAGLDTLTTHVVARCIHVIAEFGVPDALDSEPTSADELAARTRSPPCLAAGSRSLWEPVSG